MRREVPVMRAALFALTIAMLAHSATAAPLQPPLAGLSFLLGTWRSGTGQVADTGGTARGVSAMTSEAGGAVLLRRDHTELFDKTGKPQGGFDILMIVHAVPGGLAAAYFDGTHVIQYDKVTVVPGKSVTFATAPSPSTPTFRLAYALTGSSLTVKFGMAPPGQTAFRPIATGTLHRS
jgi:hypothetical protein